MITGDFTYEVQPKSFFEQFTKVVINSCSYILYDNINEFKTAFMCPPTPNASPRDLAYYMTEETKYRDGSLRRVFLNGTIARFNQQNILTFYEVPPKSFYIEFQIILFTNGSRLIDFTAVNQTKRYIEAPPPSGSPQVVRD